MKFDTKKLKGNASAALVPFVNETSIGDLKRSALLFDQLTPVFYTSLPRARRSRFPLTRAFFPEESELHRVTAELEWLYERGLLNVPAEDPFPTGFEFEDMEQGKPLWILRMSDGFMSATQRIDAVFNVTDALSMPMFSDEAPVFLTENRFREKLPSWDKAGEQRVVEVILDHFPEPDDGTPWDAILDWRSDSDAQMKRRRLIHWMNTVAQRPNLNVPSLNDEVRYLLDEYQQAMAIHDFKARSGIFRAVVTTTAEVIENLAKLKFGNLADLPFRLLGRRIERAEADLRAPGKELAYIVETQSRFAPNR